MDQTARTPRDHQGMLTYAEGFALLTAGFWSKVAEPCIHGPAGQLFIEREIWTREGPGGVEWAELLSAPFEGQSARRWHLMTGDYDPRALDSDENWRRLGPGAAG